MFESFDGLDWPATAMNKTATMAEKAKVWYSADTESWKDSQLGLDNWKGFLYTSSASTIETDQGAYAAGLAIAQVLDPGLRKSVHSVPKKLEAAEQALRSGAGEGEFAKRMNTLHEALVAIIRNGSYKQNIHDRFVVLSDALINGPVSNNMFKSKKGKTSATDENRDRVLIQAIRMVGPVDLGVRPAMGLRYGQEMGRNTEDIGDTVDNVTPEDNEDDDEEGEREGVEEQYDADAQRSGETYWMEGMWRRSTLTANPDCLIRPTRMDLPYADSFLERAEDRDCYCLVVQVKQVGEDLVASEPVFRIFRGCDLSGQCRYRCPMPGCIDQATGRAMSFAKWISFVNHLRSNNATKACRGLLNLAKGAELMVYRVKAGGKAVKVEETE